MSRLREVAAHAWEATIDAVMATACRIAARFHWID